MAPERMIRALLERGKDDWVMAADVAWIAHAIGGATSDDGIRSVSLGLIERALRDELMRIGDVTDGGFLPWEASPDQALRRVEASWRGLGRLPDLGEVCWLENTEEGDAFATSLDEVSG
ncbi:MAG: hypothetical protein ACK4V6_01595 [Microthrixaceae bacterium]